ncbi:MAG: MBL fold metallo-hydrolase [Bacteroidetes bacterium]|nr:MBL fold metallo-hydrolase [Bacteroidota bacterium]
MVVLLIIFILATALVLFLQQPVFGKNPTGERMARVLNSPNYKNNSFQNLTHTELMLNDTSYLKLTIDSFKKPKTVRPPQPLPSVKTDLKKLPAENPTIVWFGHSSYLIKSKKNSILVDPVLKGNASPVPFFGKPFAGSDVYSIEDMPPIDIVLLTHDHYDHLHYESVKKLAGSVNHFVTSLGVGSHLEHWGVPREKIIELDWWETIQITPEIKFTATPARHFSGRKFARGKTLWSSFVLSMDRYRFFLGGDSGYENHFKEIGNRFGGFDMAVLECGQYGKSWPYIHMLPEETAQAAKDLKANVVLPVHWAKFDLSFHTWVDPIIRVTRKAEELNQPITTPMIGEPVVLGEMYPTNRWWGG